MSSKIKIDPSAGVYRILGGMTEDEKKPNVVDVGEWFSRARSMREAVTAYVPRHRAPGPAA
jgi:hypothetical protein